MTEGRHQVRSVLGKHLSSFGKEHQISRTGSGPTASLLLCGLRSDDEVYALDRDDVVLDYVHEAVGTDP